MGVGCFEGTVPEMERYEIVAKLKGLHAALANRLKDPRSRYFDPPTVLEFFDSYARLRDALRALLPTLFGDLPVRERPTPSNTTDYEGRGYIIRQPLELILQDMKYALDVVASTPVVDTPSMRITREGVFFAGQYFDALRLVVELVAAATTSIVLIDSYIGTETLDLLAGRHPGTVTCVLTKELPPTVRVVAQAFKKQHGLLEIRSSQSFHDRFLILDDKDFYHFGASLKDFGKRGFMFSAIEEPDVLAEIRRKFQQEWVVATVVV